MPAFFRARHSALLVEALDGASVIASAVTGDDGTYLLPDLSGTLLIRVSDPAGQLATVISGPQTPPATFDTELAPVVPLLAVPLAGVLVFALVSSGAVAMSRAIDRSRFQRSSE